MAKKSGISGLSFSCKRALGVTSAKRKIAKATGIPTTKQCRRNKVAEERRLQEIYSMTDDEIAALPEGGKD